MKGDAEGRNEKAAAMPEGTGRNPEGTGCGASSMATRTGHCGQERRDLMEAVVERENMERALKRVMSNKGVPGVDGLRVEDLRGYCILHWSALKEALLSGAYQPQAVLGVEIPKAGGGVRQLGIPTALDRLIQQAMHQVLSPLFEPGFSDSSYGFRPGRSAHQAVLKAREYVSEGRRWVVDMDLEKFFDRVNHDVLMARVARKVKDTRILRLIRRYLQAGMLQGGIESQRVEGTPQGGPLSPLLSNILLDDLDKELERRGHAFCRYADDCNIYVKTQRSGERVMASIRRYLEERLKLKVNEAKSGVRRPWECKFLGYSMTWHKKPRLKVAPAVETRLRSTVRELMRQGRGRRLKTTIALLMPKLRGFAAYFRLAEVKSTFEVLDEWLRHKLRCLIWRQWKRVYTRAKNLMKRGLDEERAWKSAMNGRGPWWNSRASHMNQAFPVKYFESMGLMSLQHLVRRFQCGT
jgi:RNA-directed DNA polymerase